MKKIFGLLFSFALVVPFIFTSVEAMIEIEEVQTVEDVELEDSDDYLEEDLEDLEVTEDADEESDEVDQEVVDSLLETDSHKGVLILQGRKNNKLGVRYELSVKLENPADIKVLPVLTEKTDRVIVEDDQIILKGLMGNHFDFFFFKDLVVEDRPTVVVKLYSVDRNGRLLKTVTLSRGQKVFKMANGDEYKITLTTKADFIKNVLEKLKDTKITKRLKEVEKEVRTMLKTTKMEDKDKYKDKYKDKPRFQKDKISDLKEKLADKEDMTEEEFEELKEELKEEHKNKLEKLENKYQAELNKLKAKMNYFGNKGQDVLEKRVDLYDRYDVFRNNDKVKDKFAQFYDLAKDYNFYGEAFEELKAELDELKTKMEAGEDVSEEIEALKNEIEELKRKSKVAKFAAKVIPFNDVDDDSWFFTFVKNVKDKGVIKGYSGDKGGQFGPADPVTKAEILKMAVVSGSGSGFDVTQYGQAEGYEDHWAAGYIAYALDEEWSFVEDDFAPNTPATRAEVVALLMEQNGFIPEDDAYTESSFSDVADDSNYMPFIELARDLEIISGDAGADTFRPEDPINRAEASKMLHKIMELKEAQDS